MIYRRARKDEMKLLAEFRMQQLIDEGHLNIVHIEQELEDYFKRHGDDENFVQWVVEDTDGKIIATAAIIFYEFPPFFTNPSGMKGYVANVYTEQPYRKQGIATKLLEKLMDEAKERGVHEILLYASTWGKTVYQKFGFQSNDNWMQLDLNEKKEFPIEK